jgi:transposase InsO family protein
MKNHDWQIPFIINPSATEISVAAVLLQNDAAGRAHPVYYASRLLNSCEVKYFEPEKIMVALLFACTKFKHYLLSSPFPIIVQCKKDGLKQMIQQIDPAGRAARLIMALQQYDLIVKGVRGQRSAHAKLLMELGSPPTSHEGALSELEAEAEC